MLLLVIAKVVVAVETTKNQEVCRRWRRLNSRKEKLRPNLPINITGGARVNVVSQKLKCSPSLLEKSRGNTYIICVLAPPSCNFMPLSRACNKTHVLWSEVSTARRRFILLALDEERIGFEIGGLISRGPEVGGTLKMLVGRKGEEWS